MDAHTNGVSPDEQISRLVSTRIEELTHRRAQLTDEVKQINAALKRYDRMQTVLEGQPHREPATPKPKRRKGQRLSPERLDQIRAGVIAYAADHEEFRQTDYRRMNPAITSGQASIAFGLLRDEKTIRLARKQGNQLWFRLTRTTESEAS